MSYQRHCTLGSTIVPHGLMRCSAFEELFATSVVLYLGKGQVMGLLRLAVLGAPEVFHDGSRLAFSLRKAQALLVYLAVEGDLHPCSKLAAFLWPKSKPHDAHMALHKTITLLRGLLADASTAQHSHLLNEQELLGLDPHAPLELDLDVVQQAYQQARGLSTIPSVPHLASQGGQGQIALALWCGPG